MKDSPESFQKMIPAGIASEYDTSFNVLGHDMRCKARQHLFVIFINVRND